MMTTLQGYFYSERSGWAARRQICCLRRRGRKLSLARIKKAGPVDITRYLHPDHLGSPVVGTNSSGNLAWIKRYTPFGEEINDHPVNDNQAGFTGHIKDAATGLNYMQARYYDLVIGRFLSVDPVRFLQNGNPAQFNRYSYTWNDPINGFEPDGRETRLMVETKHLDMAVANGSMTMGQRNQISRSQATEAALGLGGIGVGLAVRAAVGALGTAGAAEVGAGLVPGMEGATLTGSMGAGGLKLLESSGVANATGDIVSTVLDEATTVFRAHGGTSG
ncbi:MAG: RHS repeat-associated core domain-containing protein [Alphaproteobacteria bacterium]